MDISILIVSFNTRNFIESCLNSILNSKTLLKYEIIVVDNNSKDDTNAFIAHHYAMVTLIRNTYNYGFSVAMNQAYRASKGRYLFSFNPDAEIYEDTLQRSVEYMDKHLKVAKIGLSTFNSGHLTLPTYRFKRFSTPHLIEMIRPARKIEESTPHSPFKVQWIFGTGLVIRRSALPISYLYEEKSFLFWEEYYLSRYFADKGYEMHVVPSIKILHHGSVTFKSNPSRIYFARLLSYSHEWIVRKEYFGYWNAIINFVIYTIDNYMIYLGLLIKGALKKKDLERNNELIDRKARFLSALRILSLREKRIIQIDKEAEKYFNDEQALPHHQMKSA